MKPAPHRHFRRRCRRRSVRDDAEARLKLLCIILLHDPQAQTASVLPDFRRYLRDNRYHLVHVVPKAPAGTAADAGKGEKRE